jgi:deazaflavin-dependent oxidoreductase (nitroreductase family)
MILLLTNTGRKTGLSRVTPLQFEHVNGIYYVASARGVNADWYRNILVDQEVQVEVAGEQFAAKAEPITDPARIADFLEIRLERHPRMIRAMLRLEGMPPKFTRSELEEFSREKALIALHPYPTNNEV